jgi:copper(I)-binding protein
VKLPLFFALLALVLATSSSGSAEVKAGDLTVQNAFARATPKGAPVGSGYLTIRNDGATADRLIGVAVDFAKAQVHEMKANNGIMEMREASEGVVIPAHATVKLAPGRLHLMFVDMKRPLIKGETVKATLTFERAGSVAVEMPVLPIGAAGPAGAHDMKGMKM